MPIPNDFKAVVTSLQDGTGKKGVPWATTDADANYVATYGDCAISIAQRRVRAAGQQATQISYSVVALDTKGEEVDAFEIYPTD